MAVGGREARMWFERSARHDKPKPDDANIAGTSEEHDLVHAEFYLEESRGNLERARARNASLDSRAGLLISSTAVAAVLGASNVVETANRDLSGASAILAMAAIVCGIAVLRSGKGPELDYKALRARIVSDGNEPSQDMFWVADKHFRHAKLSETIRQKKAKYLNFGFYSLAVAVLLVLLP